VSLIPDPSTPVLILGTGQLFPYGGLGMIRSLGRLGVPVYTIQDDPWSPEVRSRYIAGRLDPVIQTLHMEQWVDRLLRAASKIGGRPILIPTDDVGAVFVADNADSLGGGFRFPQQPEGLVRSLASKREMYFLCEKFDIPAPESVFPRSRADVLEFLEGCTFPVVVKAIDPSIVRSAARPWVDIARSPQELLDAYDQAETPGGSNVMLQEYIPGGSESVWMFNGYFDERSDCLIGFTGKKLRQHPPGRGVTSLGVCEANGAVEQTTREFMKALGYRGILDLGFRFDARDGRYKLLDVNPRIGATFRLFVGTRGLDVARALYLDLTGQAVPPEVPALGRRWMVENFDLLTSYRLYREGALGFSDWWRSLKGVQETAWFSLDDPVPFCLMAWRSAVKLVRRALPRSP